MESSVTFRSGTLDGIMQIVYSDADTSHHGDPHETATQMTKMQEQEVVRKCVTLGDELAGKKFLGWKDALITAQEHTEKILEFTVRVPLWYVHVYVHFSLLSSAFISALTVVKILPSRAGYRDAGIGGAIGLE